MLLCNKNNFQEVNKLNKIRVSGRHVLKHYSLTNKQNNRSGQKQVKLTFLNIKER